MNAGKLVAQIAAIAIIAYCSYSAVISAIPLDKEDLQNPMEGLDKLDVTTDMDDLNLVVKVKGDIESNLPQDIVGVKLAFFIGKDTTKLTLFSMDVGTIPSESTYTIDESMSVPIYTILAYSVCAIDDLGIMKIPIRTQLEFKYFEWQDSYLIDLGITVNLNYETTIPTPSITKDPSTNSVTMELDFGDLSSPETKDLVSEITKHISAGTYTFTCDGAEFIADIDKSGATPILTITASGTPSATAYEILQTYLDSHEELTLSDGTNDYTINKDNAESFIEILKVFYGKEATP